MPDHAAGVDDEASLDVLRREPRVAGQDRLGRIARGERAESVLYALTETAAAPRFLFLRRTASVRHGKPLPDYAGSAPHRVALTLHGTLSEPAFVRFIERIGHERLAAFSTQDFLVLDLVHRGQPVPDALRPHLVRMREQGLVARVGRGRGVRHVLSGNVVATAGETGRVTRAGGLDRTADKERLLGHIREHPGGSPIAVLLEVLPGLSRASIQRLLTELRTAGQVRLEGSCKGSKWYAVTSPSQGSDPSHLVQ